MRGCMHSSAQEHGADEPRVCMKSTSGCERTRQEIDDLCEEWQPEPLHTPLLNGKAPTEPPVISRCSTTRPQAVPAAPHGHAGPAGATGTVRLLY
jgi:hypothetical protein